MATMAHNGGSLLLAALLASWVFTACTPIREPSPGGLEAQRAGGGEGGYHVLYNLVVWGARGEDRHSRLSHSLAS